MRILLLEDDLILNEILQEHLIEKKHTVFSVFTGNDAQDAIYSKNFDILLLDVNVPNINGFELLNELRKNGIKTPAIYITSANMLEDIEKGFNSGCDDYIKKPFDIEELLLKINKYTQKSHIIILDENLYFNKNDKKLFLNNIEIELTKNERNLLILLINNKSNKVSHSQIEDYIYDRVSKSSDAIRSLVKRLRRKITKDIIFNSLDEGYYIK